MMATTRSEGSALFLWKLRRRGRRPHPIPGQHERMIAINHHNHNQQIGHRSGGTIRRRILDAMGDGQPGIAQDIAARVGVHVTAVSGTLSRLFVDGVVVRWIPDPPIRGHGFMYQLARFARQSPAGSQRR